MKLTPDLVFPSTPIGRCLQNDRQITLSDSLVGKEPCRIDRGIVILSRFTLVQESVIPESFFHIELNRVIRSQVATLNLVLVIGRQDDTADERWIARLVDARENPHILG